jgi:hypothetical protein
MSSTYNLTTVINAVTPEDKICYLNNQVSGFIAIGLIIFVIVVTLLLLLYYGYTIFTALPVALFIGSLIASLLLFWMCGDVRTALIPMIKKEIVVLIWVLFGISAYIRTVVDD